MELGEATWVPDGDAERLAGAMRQSLDRPEVVDLIVFGSQARSATTGFSDVDAILVTMTPSRRIRAPCRPSVRLCSPLSARCSSISRCSTMPSR